MLVPNFVGGAYTSRSPNIANEESINLYPETVQSPSNAKQSLLIGSAGLKLLMTAGDTGCRGMYSTEARTFAAIGGTLYELDLTLNTATSRGAIKNDGTPVSMVTNGRGGEQLLIVSAGQVKVLTLTTNVLSAAISLPLTNAPVMAAYLDAYFLLTELNTVRVWFSGLNDGTNWNALNFFARSDVNDNIVGIAVIANRIWGMGSRSTEQYYDSGGATTPFLPYPGTAMNFGAVSPWAIVTHGDSLVWLAQNSQGARFIGVGSAQFRQPLHQPIAAPAVDFALASYSTLADVESFAYEQEGHPMIGFTFPTGDVTWVYDTMESRLRTAPTWHKRLTWNPDEAQFHRWRIRGVCTVGTKTIMGDLTTGAIYQLDLETFTDNGATIRRVKRAPYLSAENQWIFLDAVELGVQSGVGLVSGQGVAPQVMLSLSRDAGHTWGTVVPATIGASGDFNGIARWQHLGRVRSDRLGIEISMSDPVRCVWGPGLNLRATPGTGNL